MSFQGCLARNAIDAIQWLMVISRYITRYINCCYRSSGSHCCNRALQAPPLRRALHVRAATLDSVPPVFHAELPFSESLQTRGTPASHTYVSTDCGALGADALYPMLHLYGSFS